MKSMAHARSIIVLVAVAFLIVASVYTYNYVGSKNSKLIDHALSSASIGIQPVGENVTVIGTLKVLTLAPSCSLLATPCTNPETQILYIVVNGRNYRLILSPIADLPEVLSGSHVVVSGLFVTPSAFQVDQWTPSLRFFGDIYVQVIWYAHVY